MSAPYAVHDPRFRRLILDNASLEVLATGARWLEGPVWCGDWGALLFSDIPNDRILRWTQSTGAVDTWRAPSGYANGAVRDRQGRVVHCHHGLRAVTRTEHDGSIATLATHYQGRRLNSPNDITLGPDGALWFSDPNYGILTDYQGHRAAQELPPALYRLDPAAGCLTLMSDAFINPNGVCFAPDGRTLYVTETGDMFDPDSDHHIARFDVTDTGLGPPTTFARISPGFADGLACDADGNLWCSAADGVHCLAPDATPLGVIHTPHLISNLCFGGQARNRLFMAGGDRLFALYVNARGA